MDVEQLIELLRLAHQQRVLAPVFGVVAPSSLHADIMERLQQLLSIDQFDTHLLQPEADQRYIPVKITRRWLRELVSTSRGQNKLGFIQPADYLRDEAANSLLKVLEEPPANTYLVLLMSQANLLPTIRSRVHLYTVMRAEEVEPIEVPDTVSAIIKLSNEWSKEKEVRRKLSSLLTMLRERLRRGEVEAKYVQMVQQACSQQSLGLDQRLLAEKILLQYDI